MRQLKFLRSNAMLALALAVIGAIVMGAVLAPWISPYSADQMFARSRLIAPNVEHAWGTDHLGRDLFTRVLYGGRTSLMVAGVSVGISFVFGVPLGILAAFYKRIDNLLMRVLDVIFSFPSILLAIFIVAILGPGMINVMIAIGITYIPRFARVVRSQSMVVVEMDYIRSARSIGVSSLGIMVRHIAPNIAGVLIVQLSLNFATAIIAEASLSFLGLGVQPPWPSWGAMLDQGRLYIELAPWASIFPGLAIFLTVLALNIVGDAMRDRLDPRLRGGVK